MNNVLTRYLEALYDDINPIDFYREIFGQGELQEKGIYDKGKYNGIIIEVTKEKIGDRRNKVLRHTLTDDLEKIYDVCERDNFCLMSPISYIGKERKSDNARVLYALTIDLDGIIINDLGDPTGLRTLFHQYRRYRQNT